MAVSEQQEEREIAIGRAILSPRSLALASAQDDCLDQRSLGSG
jgi:hypothetical protein